LRVVTAVYTLAVDAMGGDHAPDVIVEGIEIAAERHPTARFLLIGDEARLAPLLQRHRRAAAACTVRHAPETIGNDMKPTAALRVRNASMRLAIDAVAAGEAATPARCWRWRRSSSSRCPGSTGRPWRRSGRRRAATW
jgi:glycerol-3-phosphate acyltransferase PlsX